MAQDITLCKAGNAIFNGATTVMASKKEFDYEHGRCPPSPTVDKVENNMDTRFQDIEGR